MLRATHIAQEEQARQVFYTSNRPPSRLGAGPALGGGLRPADTAKSSARVSDQPTG